MLLRLRGFLGVVLIAMAAVGAVQASGSASPFGTWFGTPKFPHRHETHELYDPIELGSGPVWVQVESTGLTGASHDAADAKSTCTTRYRFSSPLSAAGWRIYVQQGKPKVSGSISGGPPTSGICGSSPCCPYRDAVRLRRAGMKLRVEFGSVNPSSRKTVPQDFDPNIFKSGYLHR
jgi:hypothetical protein